jgi:signal transduction histidine kinase
MTIRRRILVLQCVIGLALVLLGGLAYLGVAAISAKLERVQWSHRQVAVALQLATAHSNYAEQVAERLLLGESGRADLDDARGTVVRLVDESYDLVLHETALLSSAAERITQKEELARIEQMQAVLQDSDRVVQQILALDAAGRREEAIALFRTRIEDRLDYELGQLVEASVADERAEAGQADREATLLARRVLWLTVAALLATLAFVAVFARQFGRAISRPLQALTDAAQEIERGNLNHRVPRLADDEFGALARRFNGMVVQLQAQQEINAGARAQLEREVGARTSELADANRRLLQLDRQRVRFLMDVSHELRTPLTVLRGEAEVALRTSPTLDAGSREAMEVIVAQAAQMSRLIDDLLFLARSEADEVRYEFGAVAIADVIREAIADAGVIARARGARLASPEIPPDLTVLADARRLKQVLMIVLDNAIKYGPKEGLVELELAERGGKIDVVVENDSAELLDEEIARAFDRHYRGRNARAQGIAGSGLGLTIARRIVERHGGELMLARQEGRRTRVTVRLPVAEAA